MSILFENLRTVNATVWEHARNVEVTSVNIVKGTLRSGSSTSFTIEPTRKDHEFMRQMGFSKYCYETEIKAVKLENNIATLYSSLDYEGNPMISILQLEMTNEQFRKWAKENEFIKFFENDIEIKIFEEDNLDWFY